LQPRQLRGQSPDPGAKIITRRYTIRSGNVDDIKDIELFIFISVRIASREAVRSVNGCVLRMETRTNTLGAVLWLKRRREIGIGAAPLPAASGVVEQPSGERR
jgi:Holliday junction resolvase-like predicted endonuclease